MAEAEAIKAAVAGGMSHRAAARAFSVSIRQIQKAIDPVRRRELDRENRAQRKAMARFVAAQVAQRAVVR